MGPRWPAPVTPSPARSSSSRAIGGRFSRTSTGSTWSRLPESGQTLEKPPMAYKVPALRFACDALEPYIDAGTMELHHDQHHQTYVENLNKALEPYPDLAELPIENLLGRRRLDEVAPSRDFSRSSPTRPRGTSARAGYSWREPRPPGDWRSSRCPTRTAC